MSLLTSYLLILLLGVVFALIHIAVIRSGSCSSTVGVFFIFMLVTFVFDVYLHFRVDEGWNVLHDILRMACSSLSYFLSLVLFHELKLY